LKTLDKVGIRSLEPVYDSGTNTLNCIHLSHRSLKFLGIASSKWLIDQSALKQMLLRHLGNAGQADFLLLHPASEACRKFEARKNRKPGSLADTIRQNTAQLLSLRDEH